MKTICAISTGMINAAISIIRLSGPEAFEIVNKVSSIDINKQKPNTARYAKIMDDKKIIDEVVIIKYKNPRSFTGEDLIEINCHGGLVVTNSVLNLLLANGAIEAQRGEFSQRAFINGKIDLTKAEAINDLIHAQTEKQSLVASQSFRGTIITSLREDLLALIAQLEVNIDYPEYDDVEQLTQETILKPLKSIHTKCNEIIKNSKDVIILTEGLKVAIVGEPNAGKSSLLNYLVGEEKAIVTDEQGTTRDVIEALITINGVPFKLFDTAGIREATNKVEKIGISRVYDVLKKADIVVRLTPSGTKKVEIDHNNIIDVVSKSDVKKGEGITISVKDGDISQLVSELEKNIMGANFEMDNNYVTNSRQLSLLKSCSEAIDMCIQQINDGQTVDLISLDLYEAIKSLNEILGLDFKDGLLNEMFSKFCLGK